MTTFDEMISEIEASSATQLWRELLSFIMTDGDELRQEGRANEPLDKTTRELLAWTSIVDMSNPVVACPLRKIGYRFMAAESAWILSGDNRVETIAPYARMIKSFSNDGRFFDGAYGPQFVDQVGYVIRTLIRDPASRQAVMTLWRPRPDHTSKDVPCTVALQWFIRRNQLHCVVTMRSSDAWRGWPYDVHSFSMMSAYVALALRGDSLGRLAPGLGLLFLTAGSQHLYKIDWEGAEACLASEEPGLAIAPLDLAKFSDPHDLVDHLWHITHRQSLGASRWLEETIPDHERA